MAGVELSQMEAMYSPSWVIMKTYFLLFIQQQLIVRMSKVKCYALKCPLGMARGIDPLHWLDLLYPCNPHTSKDGHPDWELP